MPSKMWTVMNDLDAVTSKICSAREILDCAIDRLQEHQYDKVEQLMYAVDEFLQYYLAEFDEKFQLAWKETVVKQNEENQKIAALFCNVGFDVSPSHSTSLNYLSAKYGL